MTAKLVRNSDKRRLLSVSHKRLADSLQAIEETLSETIVAELLPHIRKEQVKSIGVRTVIDPQACDLFLRARYARDRERNVPKADSLFRAALAADSMFARAPRELAALHASVL